MASQVEIANLALNLLGQESILTLTDNNARARACNLTYEPIRDSLLEAPPPWNFATKRVALTATLTDAPAFGFTNAFALPADYKAFIRLEDLTDQFRIEQDDTAGQIIVTDLSTVNLVYIAKVTDPSKWPQLFIDVIAARMAMEMAIRLTGKLALRDRMAQEFEYKLSEARVTDARQSPIEQITGTSWLNARVAGSFPHRPIEDATP